MDTVEKDDLVHIEQRVRDFDIVVYSSECIPRSVVCEFEALPLKIALCRRESAVPTMLQDIGAMPGELVLVTSRTRLLVNLSAHSFLPVKRMIEACIATRTSYLDCSTSFETVKRIHEHFQHQATIPIVQCCAPLPFFVDLGALFVGKIHEIRDVECTVQLLSTRCGAYGRLLACSRLGHMYDGVRYREETGCYEARLNGVVGYLLHRSRRHLKRMGIACTKTNVYTTMGSAAMVVMCFLAMVLASIWGVVRRCSGEERIDRDILTKEECKLEVTFTGAWESRDEVVRMHASVSAPLCEIAAICLAQAAASIVEDGCSEMGVLTPAVALSRGGIAERLAYRGVRFQHTICEHRKQVQVDKHSESR